MAFTPSFDANFISTGMVLSNSNLTINYPTAAWAGARVNGCLQGGSAVYTGKFYQEVTCVTGTSGPWSIGICNGNSNPLGAGWYVGSDANSYGLQPGTGYKYNGGSGGSTGSPTTVGTVIMIALDLTNQKVYWGYNGTWDGSQNPSTGANPQQTIPASLNGQWWFPCVALDGSASVTINCGQSAFKYSLPTGYSAISCSSVRIYNSTDTSAPILYGAVGPYLINVLKAVLVTGYQGKPGLGQTNPYNGTNTASFQMPAGSSGCYLGVDANQLAQCVKVRGFASMTATGVVASAGTFPFPNDVQLTYPNGLWVYTSATNDSATARAWTIISNGSCFYMWIDANSNISTTNMWAFGDMSSYNLNDPCSAFIIANDVSTANYCRFSEVNYIGSATPGHYLAVKYDGSTRSVPFGKVFQKGFSGVGNLGQATGGDFMFPDPIVGGVGMSNHYIHETYSSLGVLRGQTPGLWDICAQYPYKQGDIIYGSAGTDLAGKAFMVLQTYDSANGTTDQVAIEISDTWNSTIWK